MPTENLLLFALDDQAYALLAGQVERVHQAVELRPVPQAPPFLMGVVDVAGEVVAVVDMRERCGHPSRPLQLTDQLVLAHTGRRKVALLVDEARGVERRSVLTVPEAPSLAGAARLSDGLVLIHDLERLLTEAEDVALQAAVAP